MKYTYKIENIDCAHCAQKIEQRIAKTDDFKNVSLNFATKTLRLESEKTDPLPLIQQICNELEDGVVVYESIKDKNKEKTIFNTEDLVVSWRAVWRVGVNCGIVFKGTICKLHCVWTKRDSNAFSGMESIY